MADPPRSEAPTPGAYLIYVFRDFASKPLPSVPLSPDRLLVAPIFINRLPWIRGYFATIAHEPIVADDLLRRHCFTDTLRGGFLDEHGQRVTERTEPCGEWGLASYAYLDDLISDALGLPRAAS